MLSLRTFTQALAVLGAGALAACSDSTAPTRAMRPVSLSVTTTGSASVGSAGAIGLNGVITVGGGQLTITKAQLVLGKVKLEGPAVSATTCTDDSNHDANDDSSANVSGSDDGAGHDANDDHGDASCGEMELGPVLVDLPLGSGAMQEIAVQIPEGSYNEIKLELRRPDDDNARDAAFRAAHPGFRDISVRIEGTYNDQPFVYTSAVEGEKQFEFQPPLQVSAGGTNVTLQVDVASWFTDASGQPIDPSTAGPGGPNQQQVESRIQASFHAFADHDRNGEDASHQDDHGDSR